ncbi:MAG TPA: DMT family transporter [Bosea sp. (in: a-proteobacteria)]|jgi:drug/metabolite transporter (DMT)-like permease|uniref:DMT family transporter n=1 Tax=Bosea sp. (in: a-proteobacteria) TaxID=1871050 RepID=UPI002E0FF801|nr:DMT family transporter [Bosea sp. (in: a-proteobacteria)]
MQPPDGQRQGSGRRAALLLAAMILFALSDVAAKQLGGAVPAVQIAWARYAVSALVLVLVCLVFDVRVGRPKARRHQILRGLGIVGTTLFQILALQHLALADATALYFVSPLLVTLLAGIWLRETVRPAQWCAVLLGLTGVAIVAKPGGDALGLAALLPLCSALCWAIAIVRSRVALRQDNVATTLAWSTGTGLLTLSIALLFTFRLPNGVEIFWLAAIGLSWAAAHALVALAYHGETVAVARLAPISYTYLVWALALGQLMLGEQPGLSTLAGVVLIVGAGLWSQFAGRALPADGAAQPQHDGGPVMRPARAP